MKCLKSIFSLTSKVSSLLLRTLYESSISTKEDIVEVMLHLIKDRSTLGSFEKFLPYLFVSNEFSTDRKVQILKLLFGS